MYKIGQRVELERDYEVEHELYEDGKAYLKKGDEVIVLPNGEVEVQTGEYNDIIVKLDGFEAKDYDFEEIARDIFKVVCENTPLGDYHKELSEIDLNDVASNIRDSLEMYFDLNKK